MVQSRVRDKKYKTLLRLCTVVSRDAEAPSSHNTSGAKVNEQEIILITGTSNCNESAIALRLISTIIISQCLFRVLVDLLKSRRRNYDELIIK
jgi:hypothetical protein